jgi:hypothetical protein
MKITKEDLRRAAAQGALSPDQVDGLWAALRKRAGPQQQFDFAHVAYYFGALIVIGAMGWFMTLGWEQLGGAGIFAISVGYAACFVLAGRTLWTGGPTVPGGLLYTMAVCDAARGLRARGRALDLAAGQSRAVPRLSRNGSKAAGSLHGSGDGGRGADRASRPAVSVSHTRRSRSRSGI